MDCYATVDFCSECACHRGRLHKNANRMAFVLAMAPLEVIAIDILGPLLTTKRENKFILIITGRFSKLVRTVPLRSLTALGVTHALLTHWIFSYAPAIEVTSDNEKHFSSRFFQDVSRILHMKDLFTSQ